MNLKISAIDPDERLAAPLIAGMAILVVLLTWICLSRGITTVFMHIYYLPIILLSYRYRKTGAMLSGLLTLVYLGLVLSYEQENLPEIYAAMLRSGSFMLIAVVVAVLSETIFWRDHERKLTEEALKEGEERYRSLFDSITDAIYIHSPEGVFFEVNQSACERLGYRREELLTLRLQDIIPGKFSEQMPARGELLSHTGPQIFEGANITRDGRVIPVEVSARQISYRGHTAILSISRDITERLRAEEKILSLQQFQESIITNANVWITVLDPDGKILVWNNAAETISGYPKEEVIGGNRIWKLLYPEKEYRQKVTRNIQEIIRANMYLENFETEIRCREGGRKTIWWNTRALRDPDGTVIRFIAIGRDVTREKEADVALRNSERLLTDIINFLPDATLVINTEGRVIAWNHALQILSGIAADEMLGRGEYAYAVWAYGKARPMLIDTVLSLESSRDQGTSYGLINATGETLSAETELARADGNRIVLSLIASRLRNESGEIIGAIESMRDITHLKETEEELKQLNETLAQRVRERTLELENANVSLEEEIALRSDAEDAVRRSLRYTRSLIEANPDLIVIVSESGIIKDVNSAAEQMIGLSRDTLIGTDVFSYVANPADAAETLRRISEEGLVSGTFAEIRNSDGHLTPVIVNATIFMDETGEKAIIASAHDITRQQQDQEAIQASLREKVVLLREIHHRVKNNLQIIISLLNLQVRTVRDEQAIVAIRESIQRIRAMSMVHEKLYMAKDIARIDFYGYLSSLVSSLIGFYRVRTGAVTAQVSAREISLDTSTAIPLGLAVNELVSNSLRHAFSSDQKGEIRVTAVMDGRDLILTVSDNGRGLPAGFDWKNAERLGLRLVTGLVEQLQGTITLLPGPGTCFSIRIPVGI